eukprot:359919-Chlamydomonas_euryale.AAC.13
MTGYGTPKPRGTSKRSCLPSAPATSPSQCLCAATSRMLEPAPPHPPPPRPPPHTHQEIPCPFSFLSLASLTPPLCSHATSA